MKGFSIFHARVIYYSPIEHQQSCFRNFDLIYENV